MKIIIHYHNHQLILLKNPYETRTPLEPKQINLLLMCCKMYVYFIHSRKSTHEFVELVNIVETWGFDKHQNSLDFNVIPKNRMLFEYHMLISKMHQDSLH